MAKIKRVDGEQRFYEIEGVGKFPSVTTILSIINKPAIAFWYRKEALLEVERNWQTLEDLMVNEGIKLEDALKEITKAAKGKPDEIMQEALDIGSRVHKIIEFLVKAQIKDDTLLYKSHINNLRNERKEVRNCIDAFLKWTDKVHFEPIESELMVYSERFHFAGTLDAVGKIKGKLAVIDFKSSKAFYPEMGLQISAYKKAYEELKHIHIEQMWVLRLGKEDGIFDPHKVINYVKNLKAFKSAYQLWLWKKNQEKENKKI